MSDSTNFVDYFGRDECPYAGHDGCANPSECPLDWACALDRAMNYYGTSRVTIFRSGGQYRIQDER